MDQDADFNMDYIFYFVDGKLKGTGDSPNPVLNIHQLIHASLWLHPSPPAHHIMLDSHPST